MALRRLLTEARPVTPDHEAVSEIIAYHQATKHHYHAFANGPGYLDWATQPDPFRRYPGARLVLLPRAVTVHNPDYDAVYLPVAGPAAEVSLDSIAQFLRDSLSLSAWKEYQLGGERWALRVNPSSGNLHPTEGYLLCGPVAGISDTAFIAHYAPLEHGLEIRASIPDALWRELARELPPGGFLAGLTSIVWREAWKYGERAYRYCQHDVGHALAALALAAAGLGWETRLLDAPGTEALKTLLGVSHPGDAEPEHPDGLVAVYPAGKPQTAAHLPAHIIEGCGALSWQGQPNVLSPERVAWEWAEAAPHIAAKPATRPSPPAMQAARIDAGAPARRTRGQNALFRDIVHQRRSAQEMDGATSVARDVFYNILGRTLPVADRAPFGLLPWPAQVDLALFVHRVRELEPGLYLLARAASRVAALRRAMKPEFEWAAPPGCPDDLPLYRLARGDVRGLARRISCGQDIAADGCFSLGMLAQFEDPLRRHGAWFYPRLFWECGIIGQVLYLEAEAAGLRGTGIGCFFDDGMHSLLGLHGLGMQSLYHFTVGGPLEDARLTTLPPYPAE
jgi:SagB-type dehydrogenase family enzyme